MLKALNLWAPIVIAMLAAATPALAQRGAPAPSGYYAAIAYSQSTGKIGGTYREARTEQAAQEIAVRNTGAPDAKTYIWGPDQWVAIATVDGHVGNAGFGRGATAAEAQKKALAECEKRAHGNGYRVRLCIHSSGIQTPVKDLRIVAAAKPSTAPAPSKTGYYAAIAFSPSTGKIGSSAGEAKTADEAAQLAVKKVGAPDAKAFMWGDQWVAVAVADKTKGVAGFGPGATREIAEKTALEQCRKYSKGEPCHIALILYSTGKEPAASNVQSAAATAPAAGGSDRGQ